MSKYSEKQKKLQSGEIGIDYTEIVNQSSVKVDASTNRKIDIDLKKLSVDNLQNNINRLELELELHKKLIEQSEKKILEHEDRIEKLKVKIMNHKTFLLSIPQKIEKLKVQAKRTQEELNK